MEGSAERKRLLLVDADALPEVFARVVDAKRFLATGEAATAAEASRLAGISRSAFYKYKDAVFPYDEKRSGRILTVHMVLRDRPGVLSAVLSAFADAGANILTVNQNIPAYFRDGWCSTRACCPPCTHRLPYAGSWRWRACRYHCNTAPPPSCP